MTDDAGGLEDEVLFSFESLLLEGCFSRLETSEQQRIESTVEALQQELQKTLRQFPVWAKEIREKIKAANREIAEFAVSHLIDGLVETYHELSEVVAYLKAVQQDITENVAAFVGDSPSNVVDVTFKADSLSVDYHKNFLIHHAALAFNMSEL